MRFQKWVWSCVSVVAIGAATLAFIQYEHLKEIPKMKDEVAVLQTQLSEKHKEKEDISNQLEYKENILNRKIKESNEKEKKLRSKEKELNDKDATVNLLKKKLETSKSNETELRKKMSQLQAKKLSATVSTNSENSQDGKDSPTVSNQSTGKSKGNFEVTYYNISGKTASGRVTKNGTSIAVDPKVIPLGSWVKLTFPDGTTGVYRADDTGPAVKGNIIDIYMDASSSTLRQLGRVYNVKVSLIDPS